jgi:hypothetical protein
LTRITISSTSYFITGCCAVERDDIEPRNDPDRPPALTWREPPTFDVFDSSGCFLGTVLTPRNTRILHRSGMTLWGVARGEFDEEYVVRYRLSAGSR